MAVIRNANLDDGKCYFLSQRDFARKIIFIGDSYANRVNASNKNMFQLVSEYINPAEYFYKNIAGAAFAHSSTDSKFITLLQSVRDNVPDPTEITDIVVVGGANDGKYGTANTLAAIAEFISYANKNFVNAQIWLAHVGVIFTTNGLNNNSQSVPAWKDSVIYGAKYMGNSEYVLRNTELLSDDLVHPNAAGVEYIAKQLAMGLNNGTCNVTHGIANPVASFTCTTYPEIGEGSIYSQNIQMRRNNGVVGVNCYANTWALRINFATIDLVNGCIFRFKLANTLFTASPGGRPTNLCTVLHPITNESVPAVVHITSASSDDMAMEIRLLGSLGSASSAYFYLDITEVDYA